MFQFPGLAARRYEFTTRSWLDATGFPHSEISGSLPVSGSPELIAAVHVLHRLSTPRHPPRALSSFSFSLRHASMTRDRGSVQDVLAVETPSSFIYGKSQHTREVCVGCLSESYSIFKERAKLGTPSSDPAWHCPAGNLVMVELNGIEPMTS